MTDSKIDGVLKEHLFSNAFEKSGRVATSMARKAIDEVRAEIPALSDDELEHYDVKKPASRIADEIKDQT